MAKAIVIKYEATERTAQTLLGRIANTLIASTGKDKKEIFTKLMKVNTRKDGELIKTKVVIGGKITPAIAASVAEQFFRYGCGKQPTMEIVEA